MGYPYTKVLEMWPLWVIRIGKFIKILGLMGQNHDIVYKCVPTGFRNIQNTQQNNIKSNNLKKVGPEYDSNKQQSNLLCR